MKKMLWMVAAMSVLSLVGCENGTGDGSSSGPAGPSGLWTFVNPDGNQETINLSESGGTASGSTDRGGIVTGMADASSCFLMLRYVNHYSVWIHGKINGNTMTGTTEDASRTPHRTGTFTATRTGSAPPPQNEGGNGGSSGGNRTSVVCSLQIQPGNGFGFQSVDDGGSALGSLGEMTVAQGNAEIRGSLVGLPGQQRKYLAGSYITWNSTPSAGQDLSGTFRFVLDSGTYGGTINVPGAGVQSGTPYQINSGRSVFSIGKQ
jgi:hypothetical protein